MRLRTRTGKDRHRLLVLALVATLGLACFGLGLGNARAAGHEPTLFLGIQRYTAIDKLLTDQLGEYLADHGEQILKTAALSDAERRCRLPQCSDALASDQRATFVLSGEVTSAGPNQTLRVQVRLYDARRRGSPDAMTERENLCTDCDDTKLGIVLTSTTNELLASYRLTTDGLPPVSYPPAAPRPAPAQPQPQPVAPESSPLSSSPLAVPALPPEAPSDPIPPAAPFPQAAAPVPAQAQAPPVQQAAPVPYHPPIPPSPSTIDLSTPPQGSIFAGRKKGLSTTRKAVAAVFGALGIGSLVVAGVMTGLDHKLAPNYSYNPSGGACSAAENIGRTCVLSTVGLYAPMYAVGGLLVGGMILTLAIPEVKPTPGPATE